MKVKDKYVLMELVQAIAYIISKWCKQKLTLIICTIVCLNFLISPVVYAADNTLAISFTWAYGILAAVVLGLFIYLVVVILLPERF